MRARLYTGGIGALTSKEISHMRSPTNSTVRFRWMAFFVVLLPYALWAQPFVLKSPGEYLDGHFGSSVAGIGDINGDGFGDIIVGAWGEQSSSGATVSGRAHVFSGKTTHLLYTLDSPNEMYGSHFGTALSGVGDISGDGVPDLIVGASWEHADTGIEYAGKAYVFSGSNGNLLYELESPDPQYFGGFGSAVAGIDDVNGNGFADLMVSAHDESPSEELAYAGRVYVFDGKDGALIHSLTSPNAQPNGAFGWSLSSLPDITGDGIGDLLIGTWRERLGDAPRIAGSAYVFSGQSGNVYYTLRASIETTAAGFGYSTSAAGDVDADGYADIIVGSQSGKFAEVISGADASLLYRFTGGIGSGFGRIVASAGDANKDGYADVLIAAPTEDTDRQTNAGRAYVYSGKDGGVLYTLESTRPRVLGLFGLDVASAGDINGDGYEELLVGAPNENSSGSPAQAGRAYVFNGLTGTILPVELVAFQASAVGSRVRLSWETASETNNEGFEIQHRQSSTTPGQDWSPIGWVDGAGTTRIPQTYTYHVERVQPGRHQFRLKQIDFDGSFTYSDVRAVEVAVPGTHAVVPPYPHPIISQSLLTVTPATTQHVRVRLLDVLGRVTDVLFEGSIAGGVPQQVTLDVSDLPSGTYFYHIEGETFTESGRVAVVK